VSLVQSTPRLPADAVVLHVAGDTDDGQERRRVASRAKDDVAAVRLLSHVALGLGETDRAMEYLRQAYDVRSTDLIWIGVRPVFDGIRSEPAFLELCFQVLST